jgi:hypothetical protein
MKFMNAAKLPPQKRPSEAESQAQANIDNVTSKIRVSTLS